MRLPILVLLVITLQLSAHCQDTLLLLNGKELIADSIGFNGHTITLTRHHEKGLRKLAPYKAFSIKKAGGEEKILFEPDPSDPSEFSIDQMRMFIKGEQDADRYYHNNVNKVAAFAVGAGASYFTIWGLIIPPLYATAIGSFTPRMNSSNAPESAFVENPAYCEGYQRKMRDRKIRNALVSGLAGFAAGFVTLTIINR